MTNASKNTFVALSAMIVIVAALSLGAFATIVHADDFGGFGDLGGGFGDYGYGTVSQDYGYGTIAPDTTDYGYGTIAPETVDYGYGTIAPDTTDYGYGTIAPDTCGSACAPIYSADCGCYEATYDTAYDTSYGYSYSTPYSSTPQFYSAPMTISAPSYYTAPRTVSAPVQQQQQQQQQQSAGQPINITNVNTNTNTNVNTAPVSTATVQPIVQYVYPQTYPIYQPTYSYPTYNQSPYCTITATYGQNGLVYLSWSSSYGSSAYISPNVGNVAPSGSTSLYTYGTTQYTMTVSGPGGTNSCRTNVIAPTTSVSLSQIPYTGFDFGAMGNTIYWISLVAFAAALAYLAIYFRGGAFALVSGMVPTKREVAPVAVIAPVAAPVAAPKKVSSFEIFEQLPTSVSSSTKDTMKMSRMSDGTPSIVIARA